MAKLNIQNELAAATSCDDALLRRHTVEALSGLARTPLMRLVARGEFPSPVRLSTKVHRWRSGDVRAWLRAQATEVTP